MIRSQLMAANANLGTKIVLTIFLIVMICLPYEQVISASWDARGGYLVFCLCMGRLGNQMEHLLGAIAIAADTGRTLVLPPFITYTKRPIGVLSIADVFDIDFLTQSLASSSPPLSVVTMEEFIQLANTADNWPSSERHMYCILHSHSQRRADGSINCNAKVGNPFKAFWDHYGVDFVADRELTVSYSASGTQWKRAHPASQQPVIALKGAPASYPMKTQHRKFARHFVWSRRVSELVLSFLRNKGLEGKQWVAAHIRSAADWVSACDHGVGRKTYMASPQCSESMSSKYITEDMCLPKDEVIVKTIAKVLRDHAREARHVFIGTDTRISRDRLSKMRKLVSKLVGRNIVFLAYDGSETGDMSSIIDLALFTEADFLVGNCISSFTSFANRMREWSLKKPHRSGTTFFYGIDKAIGRDEL